MSPLLKLLIVDKSPEILGCLRAALGSDQLQIITAVNGQDAISMARSQPVDLLLLSSSLSDIDGFEVYSRLRQDGCAMPVIFVTGSKSSSLRAAKSVGLEVTANDFIRKPIDLSELRAAVLAKLEPKSASTIIWRRQI